MQATDYASKFSGAPTSSPFTVTNGVKPGDFWAHTCLLFAWMNSHTSWVQPGWDALWKIWLWIC